MRGPFAAVDGFLSGWPAHHLVEGWWTSMTPGPGLTQQALAPAEEAVDAESDPVDAAESALDAAPR